MAVVPLASVQSIEVYEQVVIEKGQSSGANADVMLLAVVLSVFTVFGLLASASPG